MRILEKKECILVYDFFEDESNRLLCINEAYVSQDYFMKNT